MFIKRKKEMAGLILAVVLLLGMTGCGKNTGEPVTVDAYALNTYISIRIYDEDISSAEAEKKAQEAIELCSYYEGIFSRTLENSELYQLNECNMETMTVSSELFSLIKLGRAWSESTSGALDITIGSVSKLWDFTTTTGIIPDEAELKKALENVDYQRMIIEDEELREVNLKGTVLDLGAIAKGYIADRIKEYLVVEGIESAIINLGGNLLCIGGKGNGTFNLGIQTPFGASEDVIASVALKDMSLVTSGCYERYFIRNDRLYHHILNPETGEPAENNLLSVTIISQESVTGDALSTACYVMGLDKGMAYINSLDGIYGVFVTEDYEIYLSEGAEEMVTPMAGSK